MAKIVVAELNRRGKAKGNRKRSSVTDKRVRDNTGQVKVLRTLDASSSSFGEDLRYVFSKNVAKARRENKRVTGVADAKIPRR
jgi:hypothetical protein